MYDWRNETMNERMNEWYGVKLDERDEWNGGDEWNKRMNGMIFKNSETSKNENEN